MMKTPPDLSDQSTSNPDCCLFLSLTLLKTITQLLPPAPALTLSIGSGTGLLEALLLHTRPELCLQGVEISAGINQYLDCDNLVVLKGTWHLCGAAADATAWIFVYPRDVSLLRRYLEDFGNEAVRLIIWLGPKADLSTFGDAIRTPSWRRVLIEDCGLSAYEIMAVWNKSTLDVSKSRFVSP